MTMRIWTLADEAVRVSKAAFDAARARNAGPKGPEYEEYLEVFQTGLSCADVGARFDRSKQAIHQTYQLYFESFLGSWPERIAQHREMAAAIERELFLKEKLEKAYEDPLFLYLQAEAAKKNRTLTPVVDFPTLGIQRGHTPVFRVGESRYLRVHVRRKLFLPGPDRKLQYAAFQTSPNMLKGIHGYAMLTDIPGMDRELFLVREKLLRRKAQQSGKKTYTAYVAVGDNHQDHRFRDLDLRKFKDAWWIFDL